MPLYASPKIRKSIGGAVHVTPAMQPGRSLDKLTISGSAELELQVSLFLMYNKSTDRGIHLLVSFTLPSRTMMKLNYERGKGSGLQNCNSKIWHHHQHQQKEGNQWELRQA